MDKKPYYRMLGLGEGATEAQIKDAYEKKIHKLRSDDYADDPEYVARKLGEVKYAYSVLTGSAAPASKAQKKARFEKWKDVQDSGEDAIQEAKKVLRVGASKLKSIGHDAVCDLDEEAEEKGSRVFQRASAKSSSTGGGKSRSAGSAGSGTGTGSGGKRKKTYYSPDERGARENSRTQLRMKLGIGAVILVLGSGLLGSCVNLVSDLTADVGNHDQVQEVQTADVWERVEQVWAGADQFDFESYLDFSTCEEYTDQVEWEPGDDTMEALWSHMTDLAWYLGFYDNAEALAYITGDEDFYWDNDDLTNALTMAAVMNPPEFGTIAGATNLYTDEIILDYDDYICFLRDIAEDQIGQVAPENQ